MVETEKREDLILLKLLKEGNQCLYGLEKDVVVS